MEKLKASEVTFDYLSSLIGNSLDAHNFEIDNGVSVLVKRKVTIRNGLIHTKYLHVVFTYPSGNQQYYREQKNGAFKLV